MSFMVRCYDRIMSLPTEFPINAVIDRAQLRDGRLRFEQIVAAIITDRGAQLPDPRTAENFFSQVGPITSDESRLDVDLKHTFEDVHVVTVPGFLTECVAFLADCLTDGLAHIEQFGATTSIAPIAGRGGCRENAKRLRDHLDALPNHKRLILLPMSKGAADTLEMLALYPDSAQRIDAIVSLVGCVCGSPLHGLAPDWLKWIERALPLPTCARFGGDAVDSLSPHARETFLKTFTMPEGPKVYSLGAAVGAEEMSNGIMPSYRALCRFDPLNDGQMLLRDQVLPGATILGVLNCDHIATAMPFNRNSGFLSRFVTKYFLNRNAFPREILVEAIVRQVQEDLAHGESG